MELTDDQLNLVSKHLGIAKQKLNESASYLDPTSDRYRFNDQEADRLTEVIHIVDTEISRRRKEATAR